MRIYVYYKRQLIHKSPGYEIVNILSISVSSRLSEYHLY